jgi:hypothetical protein
MSMIHGKIITNIIFDELYYMTAERKIVWIPAEGKYTLAARVESGPSAIRWLVALTERDIDPVQVWCEEHNCGKRMSFDTFCFRSKKEMTMFLLKWG